MSRTTDTISAPDAPSQEMSARLPSLARMPTMRHVLALDDLERASRRHLPHLLHEFVAGGAETGSSLRGNRTAFAEHVLVPRVLADVSGRSMATRLFGKTHVVPFGVAPMGVGALCAYRSDLVLARAAATSGIPFILSASSLIRMEEVQRANPEAWYQAYLPGEPARIEALVDRVESAGFDTFVLTADVPVAANRENNDRNGFTVPIRPSLRLALDGITHPSWLFGTALRTLWRHGMPHFENMDATRGPPVLSRDLVRAVGLRDQLSWRHLKLIRRRWKGRLVVKGILFAEDAAIARDYGADGVIVSNHGGRQLDGAIAPLDALPAVAQAAGDMTVMLDGGIRRGTDVLKALLLGAHFVWLGRPFLYAAAVGGEEGVRHATALLAEEIDRDMALLGVRRLQDLRPEMIRQTRPGERV
jgi:L-lactate dehydrogenase (cytochrome)